MYKKFSISIYALALFFSSFIAACLSPLIYNFPLLLCNDALRKNGECMFTSGEGFYYGAIVLYLFYFMQYCFHSCKISITLYPNHYSI